MEMEVQSSQKYEKRNEKIRKIDYNWHVVFVEARL